MSESKHKQNTIGLNSIAVHTGTIHDAFGGVNTPIQPSTAIEYLSDNGNIPYPRNFNIPNHEAVSKKIAALEGGESAIANIPAAIADIPVAKTIADSTPSNAAIFLETSS